MRGCSLGSCPRSRGLRTPACQQCRVLQSLLCRCLQRLLRSCFRLDALLLCCLAGWSFFLLIPVLNLLQLVLVALRLHAADFIAQTVTNPARSKRVPCSAQVLRHVRLCKLLFHLNSAFASKLFAENIDAVDVFSGQASVAKGFRRRLNPTLCTP